MTLEKRLRVSFFVGFVLATLLCLGVIWANHRAADATASAVLDGPTAVDLSASEARRRLLDRIAIGGALVSLTAGYFFFRKSNAHLTKGMRELRAGAAALGAGDIHHEVKLHGHDEFADLAKGFGDISRNLALARRQLAMANKELEKRNEEIDQQRQVSESLLRNILPGEVADELSEHGEVKPRALDDVTILFTDFVGFTRSTQDMSPQVLVQILHGYFTEFDKIARRYELEKLKTIGDSYMCAGGLTGDARSHPVDTVLAGLEMIQVVQERSATADHPDWAVRVGIHTGPVTAGVVGIDKFAFDVWGRTVNFSSRVESTGAPNRLNVSEATHLRVQQYFDCEARGLITTKESDQYPMFFVNGLLPALQDRARFSTLYEQEFGGPPPDVPASLS